MSQNTYSPFEHIALERANNWCSADGDNDLAAVKNFENELMYSRWIFGKPDEHICFRNSRECFISKVDGFEDGAWLNVRGARVVISSMFSAVVVVVNVSSSTNFNCIVEVVSAPVPWFENGINWCFS